MESFKKYESDVSDAWSTEAEDVVDNAAGNELAHQNNTDTSNGNASRSSFRPPVNRLSSEHLRAKGLQRLALQSGSVNHVRYHRPGMAVRSDFSGHAFELNQFIQLIEFLISDSCLFVFEQVRLN
jgi:hypothetical protein